MAAAHLADTLWDAKELDRRHVSVILARIAEGVEPSTSDLMALADHGIHLHSKYRLVCVGISAEGEPPRLTDAEMRAVEAALAPWDPVYLDPHDETCFLLQAGPSEALPPQSLTETLLSRVPDLQIGIGDTVESLRDLPQTFESARHAVTCAGLFQDLGPVVDWEGAGMFRLVPDLARSPRGASALIDGFDELVTRADFEPLLHTVEVYLDSGCNAQTASVDLMLHRTSLYYRIQRFETLTGINLRHGVHRTNAHLAIKVARFRDGWLSSRAPLAEFEGRSADQLSGWTR